MDEAFGVEIGKLLDEFDAKHRAVEERKRRIKADEDEFDRNFARLLATVVKPAFLSVAALLTGRGHRVTIAEEEAVAEQGANAADRAISIRIAPLERGSTPLEPGQAPWLTVASRHYNKTVSIRSGNVGTAAAGTSGPRGDYQPAQVDTPLIEAQLLKFIRAIVSGS